MDVQGLLGIKTSGGRGLQVTKLKKTAFCVEWDRIGLNFELTWKVWSID